MHASIQYAIGHPFIAKDVSDKAPAICLYTPFRLAVYRIEWIGRRASLASRYEELPNEDRCAKYQPDNPNQRRPRRDQT
jgi:hypothetical protein